MHSSLKSCKRRKADAIKRTWLALSVATSLGIASCSTFSSTAFATEPREPALVRMPPAATLIDVKSTSPATTQQDATSQAPTQPAPTAAPMSLPALPAIPTLPALPTAPAASPAQLASVKPVETKLVTVKKNATGLVYSQFGIRSVKAPVAAKAILPLPMLPNIDLGPVPAQNAVANAPISLPTLPAPPALEPALATATAATLPTELPPTLAPSALPAPPTGPVSVQFKLPNATPPASTLAGTERPPLKIQWRENNPVLEPKNIDTAVASKPTTPSASGSFRLTDTTSIHFAGGAVSADKVVTASGEEDEPTSLRLSDSSPSTNAIGAIAVKEPKPLATNNSANSVATSKTLPPPNTLAMSLPKLPSEVPAPASPQPIAGRTNSRKVAGSPTLALPPASAETTVATSPATSVASSAPAQAVSQAPEIIKLPRLILADPNAEQPAATETKPKMTLASATTKATSETETKKPDSIAATAPTEEPKSSTDSGVASKTNPDAFDRLRLLAREIQAIEASGEVVKWDVTDPAVCHVIRTGRNQVSIVANSAGTCSVTLWAEKSPGDVHSLQMDVVVDAADYQQRAGEKTLAQLHSTIHSLYPNCDINLVAVENGLEVRGEATSEENAREILILVRKLCLVPVFDHVTVR